MTTSCSFLPAALSVNELLRERPEAAEVLNRLGIDTCCGGALSLADAAAAAGVPIGELLLALRRPRDPS